MITVMGATGHVGSRIAELLLDAGEQVRALARFAEKLAGAARLGATVLTDAGDASFLTKAFQGADAAFTLLPPDVHASDYRALQDVQGEAIASAVRASGLRHVVFLSSMGADLAEGTGPIAGLHAQEERLRRLPGVNVLILRPTYFFENFFDAIGLIKQQGINGGPIAPDLAFPMIATGDVADVAARALRRRDWRGVVVQELLGERDLTFAEATRIIGARIAKPAPALCPVPVRRLPGIAGPDGHLAQRRWTLCGDGARYQRRPCEISGGPPPREYNPHYFAFAGTLARAYQPV